jgi:hypothetical protein
VLTCPSSKEDQEPLTRQENIEPEEIFQLLMKIQKFVETFAHPNLGSHGKIRLSVQNQILLIQMWGSQQSNSDRLPEGNRPIWNRIKGPAPKRLTVERAHQPWSNLLRELLDIFNLISIEDNVSMVLQLNPKTKNQTPGGFRTRVARNPEGVWEWENYQQNYHNHLQNKQANSSFNNVEEVLMLFPDIPDQKAEKNLPFIIHSDKTVSKAHAESVVKYYQGTELEPLKTLLQAAEISMKIESPLTIRRLTRIMPFMERVERIAISISSFVFQRVANPLKNNLNRKAFRDLFHTIGKTNTIKRVEIFGRNDFENHVWNNIDEEAVQILSDFPSRIKNIRYKHWILR